MGAEEYLVPDGSSKDPAGREVEPILPGSPLAPAGGAADSDGDDYDARAPTSGDDLGAAAAAAAADETPTKPTKRRQRRASVQQWATTRTQSGHNSPDAHAEDPLAEAARARARSMSRNSAGGTSPNAMRPPPDAKITGPNQAAWEAFKSIDKDMSGLLDADEVATLAKQMKIPGVSAAKLKKQLREMDTADPHGEISFREFSVWWNRHREVERRRVRRDVKELFDLADDDGSGLLDKDELAQFVRKAQKFKSLREVIDSDERPFDLEKDWRVMRRGAPPKLQGVSFPMFESWWKDRAGAICGHLRKRNAPPPSLQTSFAMRRNFLMTRPPGRPLHQLPRQAWDYQGI